MHEFPIVSSLTRTTRLRLMPSRSIHKAKARRVPNPVRRPVRHRIYSAMLPKRLSRTTCLRPPMRQGSAETKQHTGMSTLALSSARVLGRRCGLCVGATLGAFQGPRRNNVSNGVDLRHAARHGVRRNKFDRVNVAGRRDDEAFGGEMWPCPIAAWTAASCMRTDAAEA